MWKLLEFLIRLINYDLYVDDICELKKGDDEMGKIIKSNGAILNGGDPGFDIPELEPTRLPEVGKDVEKEEFTTRMKALSEEELEWLMEVIPLELCLKKIEREVAKVEEYKRVVKDISKAFD